MIVDPAKSAKSLHQGMDAHNASDLNIPQALLGPPSTQSALCPNNNPPPYLLTDVDNNPGALTEICGDHKEKPPQDRDDNLPDSYSSNNGPSYLPPRKNYPSFEPMFLIALGQHLTRGFPNTAPPSKNDPHPFISHDIPEADWLRFLGEVKVAGQLSESQERYSQLPIVSILPIVGPLSTHAIRQQMKKGKSKEVAKVIDNWNHHFFNPRQMEVVLMHGATKLSGLKTHLCSNASIPGPSIRPTRSEPSIGKGKGKAKEEDDTTYRLFVMPLSTAN